MKRRQILISGLAVGVFGVAGQRITAQNSDFEISRTDEEWRAMLTPKQYKVMRNEGTERAHSSPLDENYLAGTYHCRGCGLAIYSSETKFDSGTGWPSFWQSLPDAVATKPDNTLFSRRTEVHCRRCGSHLGHIFNDGPQPTGKRHCLNGVSLEFIAL